MTKLLKVAKFLEQKYLRKESADLNKYLDSMLNYIDSRLVELKEKADVNDYGVIYGESNQLKWLKNIIIGNRLHNIYDYGLDILTQRDLDILTKLSNMGETEKIQMMAKNILRLLSYYNTRKEEQVA